MTDDAIAKLQQQAADMARQEGYSKGFAAAMNAMEEFISSMRSSDSLLSPAPIQRSTTPVMAKADSEPAKSRLRRTPDKPYLPRMTAGAIKQELVRAYEAIQPHAAGPTEIQHTINQKYGKVLARSSIARGIKELAEEGILEEIRGTKTWRRV